MAAMSASSANDILDVFARVLPPFLHFIYVVWMVKPANLGCILHMHSILHIFWFAYCIGYMQCKLKLKKCIFYAYCISISNQLNSATMFKIKTFITPSKSSCWLLSSIRFQLQFYSAAYYSWNTWRKNAQAAYIQICNMQYAKGAYCLFMLNAYA